MSYIALYRKWRPLVFEDVVEQEHVVKTLKNSVSAGRIAHAYLFCGTRGTGKTTMAHILSRAINCLSPKDGDPCNECEICRGILSGSILDVLEIDAASNNSVDNIREIRDEVIYAPSHAKYKVYIIDEVHMLSSGAFNALLKTLEEPPSHVVFILATTEPHRLPATILSRCQRFDFRRITVESIMGRLGRIAAEAGIELQEDASRLIARLSDGALRDAISLLDQCIAMGGRTLSYDDVLSVAGIVRDDFIRELVASILSRDAASILGLVEKLVMDGKDIVHFTSDLILYFRNLLICKITDRPQDIIEASPGALQAMQLQSSGMSRSRITGIIKELSALEPVLKWSTQPRIILEVNLLKLCSDAPAYDEDLAARVSALEDKLSEGVAFRSPGVSSADAAGSGAGAVQENAPAGGTAPQDGKSQPDSTPAEIGKPPAGLKPRAAELAVWSKVIAAIKESGRMAVYVSLIGTKALQLENSVVGIVFKKGNSFNKMNCSRAESREIIENQLARLLGKEIRIKLLDEEDADELTEEAAPLEKASAENNGGKGEAGAPAASKPDGRERPAQESAVGDEFVDKARDIAAKLNAPLTVFDE